MDGIKNRILYYTVGALSGLSGLVSMPTCGGNTCSSCPGCWGMGIGMVILVIIKRVGGKKG